MSRNKITEVERSMSRAFEAKASGSATERWMDNVMLAVKKESIGNSRDAGAGVADYYMIGAVWAFSFAMVLVIIVSLTGLPDSKGRVSREQVKMDESDILENIILKEHI